MTEKEETPMEQSNTEEQETKFEATVYQTLLKILQGINLYIKESDSLSSLHDLNGYILIKYIYILGDFTSANPMMGNTHHMIQDPLKDTTPRGKRTQSFRRNPFQNPPRYPTRKGY